jgi:hypothetical protein
MLKKGKILFFKIENLKNRLVLHKNRVERFAHVCYHSFRLINYILWQSENFADRRKT